MTAFALEIAAIRLLPRVVFTIINIILPGIALLMVLKLPRLDSIKEFEEEMLGPGLVVLTIVPIMVLMMADRTFNIVYSYRFLMLVVVPSIVLFSVIKLKLENTGGIAGSILIIGILLIYFFTSITHINCFFDYSQPKVYSTVVAEKYISSSSKGGTYYNVVVQEWNRDIGQNTIEVERKLYDNIQPGQTIRVNLKKGLLGLKWYYIEQ